MGHLHDTLWVLLTGSFGSCVNDKLMAAFQNQDGKHRRSWEIQIIRFETKLTRIIYDISFVGDFV